MKNTEAEKNIRAKTGTLTHIVALSGYLKEGSGGLLAFSIMSNNSLRSLRRHDRCKTPYAKDFPFSR